MNISEVIIDDAIKSHVLEKKRDLNIYELSRKCGSAPSTVWRQFKKAPNIRADTFFKLMYALDNLSIDEDSYEIKMIMRQTPENKRFLNNLSRGNIKNDFGDY